MKTISGTRTGYHNSNSFWGESISRMCFSKVNNCLYATPGTNFKAVALRMCKLTSFAIIAALALLGSVYCEADETASNPPHDDRPELGGGWSELTEKEHLLKAIYHIMQGAKLDTQHLQNEHHPFGPWRHIEHSHTPNDTGRCD